MTTLLSSTFIATLAKIDKFSPYSHYAAAVKCSPHSVAGWNCGANCAANPTFQTSDEQFWFVGYDQYLDTVIGAHQGTDKKRSFADFTDSKVLLTSLDGTLFPSISTTIQVHKGFAEEQSKTAVEVLEAVNILLGEHPSATVATVEHSLGATLALLDGVYLRLQLDTSIRVRVIGMLVHINNMRDPVPIVPGMSLGYHHCRGEIHIQESGEWITCAGQDNPDPRCIVGTVSGIYDATFSDHRGPYNGITLTCD